MDDLTADWDDAHHHRYAKTLRALVSKCIAGEVPESAVANQLRNMPRLNALDHPLVRHFDASFALDQRSESRESISGLSAPHWWKQKTSRWRGAATDHSAVGPSTVWLCAAGVRRQGDTDDFYAAFMRDVTRSGPQPWLPTDEDLLAGKVDDKILALDAWKLQIHCSALALLAEALQSPGETYTVEFPAPSRGSLKAPIGQLSMGIESVDVDGTELGEVFLVASILNRKQIKAVDVAVQIARAALQSNAEVWHSTTYTGESYAFSALIDPIARAHSEELARSGTLPAESVPGGLRIGLHAHYARKHGLVDAQVEGSSVLSLCGYWFVPTADHMDLETCGECSQRHDQMGVV
ncbi:DUF3039 domain-containing protein [Arthrobacter oryzae]|uniref:DUF3039 domain-containing protein n=1 Tax=Arthrobacter oryzae TaxID=409290 RepID=UPI001606CAEA|nr:DUF3039 domain-containing protein [Arthrobacter oryzae]